MSWFSDWVEDTTGWDPPDLSGAFDDVAPAYGPQWWFDPEAAAQKIKDTFGGAAEDIMEDNGFPTPESALATIAGLGHTAAGRQGASAAGVSETLDDLVDEGVEQATPPDSQGPPDDIPGLDDEWSLRELYDRFGRSDTNLTGGYGEGGSRRRTLLG